jgi:hypothetical protein
VGGWGSGPRRWGPVLLVEHCAQVNLDDLWPQVREQLRGLQRKWGVAPVPVSITLRGDVTVPLDYSLCRTHLICPRCGARRRALYLPDTWRVRGWGCRGCLRLRYASQEAHRRRARNRPG